MRFLFFYFFLCPSSSREEEEEREKYRGRPKPRTASAAAVLQITFRHSARRVLVRLTLSPREIRKGKKRQTNALSGHGAKLAVDDATPSLHIRLDLTTPSPRGMDRFCRKKCRFSMTHLFFPSCSRWASWRWSTRSAGSPRPRTRVSWRSSSLVTPDTPRSVEHPIALMHPEWQCSTPFRIPSWA